MSYILQKHKLNSDSDSDFFENGKYYGVPVRFIGRKYVLVDAGDFYPVMAIDKSEFMPGGSGQDIDESDIFIGQYYGADSLIEKEDLLLLQFDKKTYTFIEPLTSIRFPFVATYDSEAMENQHPGSYEDDFNHAIEYPLIIDAIDLKEFETDKASNGDAPDYLFYEDDELLRKLVCNEAYKDLLIKLKEQAISELHRENDYATEVKSIISESSTMKF